MKSLDEMTVRAVSNTLCNLYQPDFDPSGLMGFFRRAGVDVPEPFRPFSVNALPSVSFTAFLISLNGSSEFEKILARLASPKEDPENRARHRSTVRKLNEILWAEGLEIVMDGPDPVIKDLETSEQEGRQMVNDNPASPDPVQQPVTNASNEIFVVHGRDLGAKDTVARFLERIKMKPVILQELDDYGNTVIEKFEHHADQVGFAIVLFTPDDIGALKGEFDNAKPRARQNVIFELGYFIGKLGRDGVRVLVKGEVEILTDYSGVLYITMGDNDGWKLRLVQELQSAGYDVDANDAL